MLNAFSWIANIKLDSFQFNVSQSSIESQTTLFFADIYMDMIQLAIIYTQDQNWLLVR